MPARIYKKYRIEKYYEGSDMPLPVQVYDQFRFYNRCWYALVEFEKERTVIYDELRTGADTRLVAILECNDKQIVRLQSIQAWIKAQRVRPESACPPGTYSIQGIHA